ncbi:MAG: c-type cytochrome [Ignavibacteria bacterium]
MNFLEKFVLPPTPEHAALLNVIQVLAMLMFIPYSGMITGGLILSLVLERKSNINSLKNQFSFDIIQKFLLNKKIGYTLGVIPLITIVLVYFQFLYGNTIVSLNLMILATMLFIVGFIFMYKYVNRRRLFELLKEKSFDDSFTNKFLEEFNKISAGEVSQRAGIIAITLILLGLFLFVGSITIAANPLKWKSIQNIGGFLIDGEIWLNFLFYILIALTISTSAILYFFLVWQGGIKNRTLEYLEYVKLFASKLGLFLTLITPIFIFLGLLLLPQPSLSPIIYILTFIIFAVIIILSNLYYQMLRTSVSGLAAGIFFTVFVLLSFLIVKDQLVFGNAIKPHLTSIVFVKAEELAKEREANITTASGIDAEKIFNEKCSACHKFDVKVVGPPYNETVPKYNGDIKKLASYIYTPQKINPEYPPMPNQGLKQKEAEAMAKWLIDKVGKK